MEDLNKLIGGLNTDVHPSSQPQHTTRDMVNFIPLSKDGNIYSVSNELGTVAFDGISFPEGFAVIGYSILNTDIIVILADDSGNSQVGTIRDDSDLDPVYGKYHPIAPVDPDTGIVPVTNKELRFTKSRPVDCVSRKLINGHRILYYTDNNIPFGQIDLDSPPSVGSVESETGLIFNQTIPKINIKEIRENVFGTFLPGIYQIITRYVTDTGGVTTFGIPSNMMPMVPTNRSVGPDNYKGAFNEDGTINKNIVLSFTDVDTQYQELEIVALYYEGSQSVFKASVIGQIPITGDELEYTFTGINSETAIDLTKEELRKIPVTYTRAKCIEQKDNTLFLSNLSSDSQQYDETFQNIANNIKVKYRIDEVQFSGRGDNGTITDLIFKPQDVYINEIGTDVIINYNKDVDVTTAASNYILQKQGDVGSATITVSNATNISDGDQIQMPTYLTQGAVNFTAEAVSTGTPDYFVYVPGDNNTTAANIAETINGSSNVTDYVAFATANVVTVYWGSFDTGVNGLVVNYTGPGGAIATTNFAGASAVPSEEVATAISISGSQVIVTFPPVVIPSYELQIISTDSVDGDNYSTGDSSGPFLDITFGPFSGGSGALEAGFTDYVGEEQTFNKKTYKRGEVYSLGMVILWKNGSYTNNYHIAGEVSNVTPSQVGVQYKYPSGTWPSFSQSAVSSGNLGTYVSDAQYPQDQGYPEDLIDGTTVLNNVRHHLMPSLENEPHFRIDGDGITWIRLLNLEFEFTVDIPQEILKDISEIIFTRERRNTDKNKSILAQGLVSREGVMADQYNNSGEAGQNNLSGGTAVLNPKDGYFAGELPFFDNTESAAFTGTSTSESSGHTRAGFAYPNLSGGIFAGGTYNDGKRQNTNLFNNRVFFHSPETELLTGFRFDSSLAVASNVKPVLNLRGDYDDVAFVANKWEYDPGDDFLKSYMYCDMYADYNNYETSLSATTRKVTNARYVEPGSFRTNPLDSVNESALKTSSRWAAGGLEILADGNLSDPGGSKFTIVIDMDLPHLATISTKSGGSNFKGDILDSLGGSAIGSKKIDRLKRYLYDIELENNEQYGQLTTAAFIPIARRSPVSEGGTFIDTHSGIYEGDTFISKYAYNGAQLVPYAGYTREAGASTNRPQYTKGARPTGYAHVDGINRLGSTEGVQAWGLDFRWNTYFFVESQINTNYRHVPEDEEKQDYFPNENNYSTLLENYRAYLGNVNAYNTQYSYENNIKEYFIKGSTQTVISKFENRTIYSEQAAEDDTLDSYRSFLQNDYYDLPSNTGPIWDTFVEYNSLFMHTPKSLWRTFAEPAATIQGGNISDAVLGTGRLFARPSFEMLTTKGGYAGSISQFGGAHTQIGYIFPDILQGKVFALATGSGGPHLKELSNEGLQTFIHENLGEGIIKTGDSVDLINVTTDNAYLIDNPFIGIGINGGYDYKLKRYFLNKHSGFTLTFSIVTNNWFSFHDYRPNVIIPYDNRVLFLTNNPDAELWEMNIGKPGDFFNTIYDSKVEIVCSAPQYGEKTFQNFKIYSDSTKDSIKVRDDNFSKLQCFTDRMNSGDYELIPGNTFNPSVEENQLLIKFRNNEYRLTVPRDSVINNDGNIFDPDNIYIFQGGNIPVNDDYFYRERLKGYYLHSIFIYDNKLERFFILNGINTIFNKNIR
jgi:hypothetical protein